MSDCIVFLTILVFAGSAVFLYLLTIKGLMVKGPRFRDKALFLALIIAGAVPYVIAFGNSRYNLPQIALLIPVAAFGLTNWKERQKAFLPISVLAVAGLAFLFYRSYPDYIYQRLRPSSIYTEAVGALDRASGVHSLFGDGFVLEKTDPEYGDTLILTIVDRDGSDYSFAAREPLKQIAIALPPKRKQAAFTVFGRALKGPLELRVFSKKRDAAIELEPTGPAYWNRFKETELPGIRLSWRGGR